MASNVLGKNTSILNEVEKMVRTGTKVTRKVSQKVIQPTLKNMDKGVQNLGKKYQKGVDGLFR